MKHKKRSRITSSDTVCRAEAIREETWLKAARLGPRI
jgi:hypothetical protein